MKLRHVPPRIALLSRLAIGPPSSVLGTYVTTPVLTLAPERGPCDTFNPPITARGRDFPAGVTVTPLAAVTAPTRGDVGGGDREHRVSDEGTFAAPARLAGYGPGSPAGAQFTISAVSDHRPDGGFDTLLATTTCTVAAPARSACFAETGRCVGGRFLDYCEAHGGLPLNGFSISDKFDETLEDGKPYQVQYFERARFELHPENPAPSQVLLGQFGRRILAEGGPGAERRRSVREGGFSDVSTTRSRRAASARPHSWRHARCPTHARGGARRTGADPHPEPGTMRHAGGGARRGLPGWSRRRGRRLRRRDQADRRCAAHGDRRRRRHLRARSRPLRVARCHAGRHPVLRRGQCAERRPVRPAGRLRAGRLHRRPGRPAPAPDADARAGIGCLQRPGRRQRGQLVPRRHPRPDRLPARGASGRRVRGRHGRGGRHLHPALRAAPSDPLLGALRAATRRAISHRRRPQLETGLDRPRFRQRDLHDRAGAPDRALLCRYRPLRARGIPRPLGAARPRWERLPTRRRVRSAVGGRQDLPGAVLRAGAIRAPPGESAALRHNARAVRTAHRRHGPRCAGRARRPAGGERVLRRDRAQRGRALHGLLAVQWGAGAIRLPADRGVRAAAGGWADLPGAVLRAGAIRAPPRACGHPLRGAARPVRAARPRRIHTSHPRARPCQRPLSRRPHRSRRARGGFTPDTVTRFTVRRDRDGEITGGNSQSGGKPTHADGTYESTISLSGCGHDEPVGSPFTITVAEYYPDRMPTAGPGASAVFTVTAAR